MNSIKNGDIVKIRKGSIIESYNPSKLKYILTRSQKVKINHQHSYYDTIRNNERIVWIGTGSYLCWTDTSNIITD